MVLDIGLPLGTRSVTEGLVQWLWSLGCMGSSYGLFSVPPMAVAWSVSYQQLHHLLWLECIWVDK